MFLSIFSVRKKLKLDQPNNELLKPFLSYVLIIRQLWNTALILLPKIGFTFCTTMYY